MTLPHLHRQTPEQAARAMAERELPSGWSADVAPTWDAALRQFFVCATGPGFRIRGGHGGTRASAWEDLALRLRTRRIHVQRPTRLGLLMLLAAVPLLIASLAGPLFTIAADPVVTPAPSSGPIAWALPSPSWGPAATIPAPTPAVTPAPARAAKIPLGAPRFGKCLPPNMGDRRAGNSPEAQAYLASKLTTNEWNCAWWLVMAESSWRSTSLNWRSGACGLPQSYPCSKLANYIAARHPDTCVPTRLPGLIVTWACDWRAYPLDQVDWLYAYVRTKYGSFLRANTVKFGYLDATGYHRGQGFY